MSNAKKVDHRETVHIRAHDLRIAAANVEQPTPAQWAAFRETMSQAADMLSDLGNLQQVMRDLLTEKQLTRTEFAVTKKIEDADNEPLARDTHWLYRGRYRTEKLLNAAIRRDGWRIQYMANSPPSYDVVELASIEVRRINVRAWVEQYEEREALRRKRKREENAAESKAKPKKP